MLKIFKRRFSDKKANKDNKQKLKQDENNKESQSDGDVHIPTIIMHSFGGSKEIAESLSKLTGADIYFSFCQIKSEVHQLKSENC